MSNRTTKATLEALCDWINEETGNPLKPYQRGEDGKLTAQVGNYHLSLAYGGVCVHRMGNASGGCSAPIWSGHIPKREAEGKLRAFLSGIRAGKGEA